MKTICIDPGHGGADPGCQFEDFTESMFNLSIGLQLRRLLIGSGWPIKVIMTRENDTAWRLVERATFAKANDADLVFAIHANSFKNPDVRGAMFFHWPNNEVTQRLAAAVATRWPYFLHSPRRDIVPVGENYPSAKHVVGVYEAPCLLIESGFASNPEDREFLNDDNGQREMVAALAGGVARFLSLATHSP